MCYGKSAQEAKDMEKIIKKLEEVRRMYEVVGLEVKQHAEAGHYTQLKSAQNRSMSLAKKVMGLEDKLREAAKANG